MFARDNENAVSKWKKMGTWTVPSSDLPSSSSEEEIEKLYSAGETIYFSDLINDSASTKWFVDGKPVAIVNDDYLFTHSGIYEFQYHRLIRRGKTEVSSLTIPIDAEAGDIQVHLDAAMMLRVKRRLSLRGPLYLLLPRHAELLDIVVSRPRE